MLSLFRWSLWFQPSIRLSQPHDLTPFVDDSARRLVRAPETLRHASLVDCSLRPSHGRDPPR